MECLSDLGAGATPFRHKSPQANKEALCGFASLWRVEGDPPIVAELFDGLSDIVQSPMLTALGRSSCVRFGVPTSNQLLDGRDVDDPVMQKCVYFGEIAL